MTDPWTNQEIQRDPAGYLAWQERERTRAARERKEAEAKADFESFKTLFIERGGAEKDARKMYDKYRSEKALEEAAALDKRAREAHRSERVRQV